MHTMLEIFFSKPCMVFHTPGGIVALSVSETLHSLLDTVPWIPMLKRWWGRGGGFGSVWHLTSILFEAYWHLCRCPIPFNPNFTPTAFTLWMAAASFVILLDLPNSRMDGFILIIVNTHDSFAWFDQWKTEKQKNTGKQAKDQWLVGRRLTPLLPSSSSLSPSNPPPCIYPSPDVFMCLSVSVLYLCHCCLHLLFPNPL